MESSVFELRKLRKDDFDKWKELWSTYLSFYDSEVTDLVYETTFGRLVSKDNKAQNAIVLASTQTNRLVILSSIQIIGILRMIVYAKPVCR